MKSRSQSDKLDEVLIKITRLEENMKNLSINMEEMKVNNSERNRIQDVCTNEIRKVIGLTNGDSKKSNSILGRLTNLETRQYAQDVLLKVTIILLGAASTIVGILAKIKGVI